VRSIRILLIAALVCATSSAAHASVSSMHLVAPNVGWATTEGEYRHSADKLFWTTDGGAHWSDITPKLIGATEDQGIESVSFLDAQTGWVLICCGYTDSKDPNLAIEYDLAKTTDAGATWSIARVNIPPDANYYNAGDANGGAIEFADSLHGWVTLTSCGGHSCGGPLLATSDGGRTWRATKGGGGEPLSLVTPTFGWSVEIPNPWVGDDESSLSVTRDGAKSWQQVSVPFPKEMISASDARQLTRTPFYHDLPTFKDSEHGFLPITYLARRAHGNSAIVLFETTDAGRTWNPIRALTKLYIPGQEATNTVEVAGSTLIAATSPRDDRRVILSRVGPSGRTDTDISKVIGGSQGVGLSFVTPAQGWMATGGDLLSTSDGGASWTKLDVHQEAANGTRRNTGIANSMQLLSSNIGWMTNGVCFCRTEDGGATWTDITPRGNGVSDAFFLTANQGWALERQQGGLVVFSTTDAGTDWTVTNVTVPGLHAYTGGDRPASQIYFEDSLHGWISVDVPRSNDPKIKLPQTALLATSDGGKTWVQAGDVGKMGYLRFATPTDGWMVVPPNRELYVTQDGAKSWTKVSIAAPKEISPANEATYDLPTFEDSKHGFLPVTYSGGLGVNAAVVLFETEDGGQNWKSNRTLTGLTAMPVGTGASSTVVGSDWILANVSGDTLLPLTKIADGATAVASSNAQPGYYGARQLSFATPSVGWVLLRNGRLLVTTDRGSNWSELDWLGGRGPALQPVSAPKPVPFSRVESAQLITPDIGWAVGFRTSEAHRQVYDELFRTEDRGVRWKSITPVDTNPWRHIYSVFFLDSKRGWALVSTDRGTVAYSTVNGGTNWSAADVDIGKDQAGRPPQVLDGQIFFVNPRQGFIIFGTRGPKLYLKSALLATSDGGRTWSAVTSQDAPPAGRIRFVSPEEGWLIPMLPTYWMLNGSRMALFVTRDGAKSWQQPSLARPANVPARAWAYYDLPSFMDSKNGYLPVFYDDVLSRLGGLQRKDKGSDEKSFVVLYRTVDGGETWKPERTVANIGAAQVGDFVATAMVGSSWIISNTAGDKDPTITSVANGATVEANPGAAPGYFGARQLSFVSRRRGWVLSKDKRLLSTNDGGATWTELSTGTGESTPHPPRTGYVSQ
jgi:photosystem II stability/assembly factor-like uncharacterized protein